MSHDSNESESTALEPGRVRWRKSTFTLNGDCVTVGKLGDRIAVRNSNDPDGGTLFFTRSEIAAWIAGVKAGEFDDLVT